VIAVIDLDSFKQLNDTHGHAVGDQALVAVGAALQENCRPTAVIGRVEARNS
jgi:diguanylate cyclase (GGDEF)-like protein